MNIFFVTVSELLRMSEKEFIFEQKWYNKGSLQK